MSSSSENDSRREKGGAAPDGDRQWRVLFIGDHGKVIAFKRIKTLIGLTIGVIATALVTVAVLVVVNARQHARMQEVQEHLSAAQLQIQALRQERDLLTAHVVLAETKVKEVLAGVSRSASVQKPELAGIAGKAIESRGPPPPEASTEGPPASAEPAGGGRLPAGIEEPVAVEDFYAGLDAAHRTLHLRYNEPVSALDVSIRAQIVNLMQDLQRDLGLAYLFIAHDLAVVRHISRRIAIMYAGKIVEVAERDELYRRPLHPYTQALLSAVPVPDPKLQRTRRRITYGGEPPNPLEPPPGCRFQGRCPHRTGQCRIQDPPLAARGPGHAVACWNT